MIQQIAQILLVVWLVGAALWFVFLTRLQHNIKPTKDVAAGIDLLGRSIVVVLHSLTWPILLYHSILIVMRTR